MATEYSITYTYTGQENRGADAVPMEVTRDKFTLSGDTDRHIGKITRIVYSHAHRSTNSPTWELFGRLHFADGSYIDTDTQSKKFASNIQTYEQSFPALPTAAKLDTWTKVETIRANTPNADLYWEATSSNPLTLTVYFTESPPVYRRTGGAWVEVDSEGIFGKAGGAWKAVENITKT